MQIPESNIQLHDYQFDERLSFKGYDSIRKKILFSIITNAYDAPKLIKKFQLHFDNGSLHFLYFGYLNQNLYKAALEEDADYEDQETKLKKCKTCCNNIRFAIYIAFIRIYLFSYMQSFITLLTFLCMECKRYFYKLCCVKKEKVIVEYVEEGESPTKGQVGMKVSFRHDFNSHDRYRNLYEWRDATIIDRQCFGDGVKIAYDDENNVKSSPKRWIKISPKKMKWRSKVENKYGVEKELSKYNKDIEKINDDESDEKEKEEELFVLSDNGV